MKAIKNRIGKVFSFCVFLASIISLSLIVQSCANTSKVEPATKADMVVSSKSYEAFEKSLNEHKQGIMAALRKLSDEERKEVRELFDSSEDNYLAKVGKMIGYDLEAGLAEIDKLHSSVEFLSDITPEEYNDALSRRKQSSVKTKTSEKGDAYAYGCTIFYTYLLHDNKFFKKSAAGKVWIKCLTKHE